ncbi:GDP-mannose 4,6-dehydratase [Sediminibacterium soli]|uniref:GDP-mannose 4,6-dehydratase n=1 Tax=Sediminibacterium soli TaxID=2698829 RepID=UPI0013797640|nr:GDP-mannose 4,6-dehydratase [Sediminibacterium soli]NCI48051.1 GDP-mannose 4,6-dehydratase [Sediminibacterium soli]
MRKVALITGITGQDGSYLSKLLLEKGFHVVGVTRSYTTANVKNLSYLGIQEDVEIAECDLFDIVGIIHLLRKYKPAHIYNLAAQSSVSLSFDQPIGTIKYNIESVLNLLEAIRLSDPTIRFYQASSSEMYGAVNSLPVSLSTHLNPVSPYAVSKASAFMLTNNYRNAYQLFAVNGILFNHESYLRTENFFVKKVITQCLQIRQGKKEQLGVGNIDIKRDFGYAPDYVEAMFLAMNHDSPGNYLVCSGKSISLREIVLHVFSRLGIDPERLVIDPSLYRPSEIEDLYGDNTDTRSILQWNYAKDFTGVLDLLIEEELANS